MSLPANPPPEPSLWAQRAYLRLWLARLAGVAAGQMLMVAIGWQMYDLTASAWDLGLVGLMQFLPSLTLVLVTGHALDRYHRARILAACMALQAAVALALMLGAWHGFANRSLLLGLSVVIGAAKAFQLPAQQSITPLLVPASLLPRALAFSSAGMQAAIIAGPAIGGFVYVAGATAVYASCAALFVLAGALVLALRYEHEPAAVQRATLETLLAGVRFVWQRRVVLGAISLDLFAVLLGGATALLPMFAKDILHTGPWGLGLLRAAPALGALGTALLLARWPIRRRAGTVLLAAVGVYGAATLGFALSTWLVLSIVMLAVSGAADMISVVIRQSLVQLETPEAMRGRVSAVNSVFIGASNQLGEFESGLTAALLGPVGSVLLGGLGSMAIAALWAKVFPALARRDRLVENKP